MSATMPSVLPPADNVSAWPLRARPAASAMPARAGRAALGSAFLHLLLLGCLFLATLAPIRPPREEPGALALVFEAPVPLPQAATTVEEPAEAVPAARAPQVVELASLPPLRLAVATPLHVANMPDRMREPSRRVPTPAPAISHSTPDAAPAAAPAAPAVSPAIVAGLEARIRRAVQDAATYPPAARQMHREGRAQVKFAYSGGMVADVVLAQSSQSSLLDRAALAAVSHASYPLPPAGIAHTRLPLLVWVNFGLVAQD